MFIWPRESGRSRFVSCSWLISGRGRWYGTVCRSIALAAPKLNNRTVRVFRFAYLLRMRHKLVMLCAMFKSPAQKLLVEDQWLATISPIGKNPLTMTVPYRSWASECISVYVRPLLSGRRYRRQRLQRPFKQLQLWKSTYLKYFDTIPTDLISLDM